MRKKILIITGEASGDLHAANLVQQIHALDPAVHFIGMGGPKMRAAGVEIIQDIQQLSVIGFTQILAQFPALYAVFKKIKNIIQQTSFDLIILVDCPGYNLRFAKIAKRAQQKVFYYISPQLWAWHQSRVKIVKKNVDLMAVVFPFEIDFYKKFHVNAKFVGHPLSKTVKPALTTPEAKKTFGLTNEQLSSQNSQALILNPIIGLLPGSRRSEIKRMLPIMLQSAELIKIKFPLAQFILPLASSLSFEDIKPYLEKTSLDIKVIPGQAYDVINVSDAVIVTSGTATLETTLLHKPFVIIYKDSFLTYLIARMVIKVQFLGLCNLLAGKAIVQEFLQYDAKPHAIANEIMQILNDEKYRLNMITELAKIKDSLKTENAENFAELILLAMQVKQAATN